MQTTGLLLFTNDGELAKKLTHPSYEKKKVYHVHLDKDFLPEDLEKISKGIELEDGFIAADDIQLFDANDSRQVGIEIHSGKNRIVRRIFNHLGYNVEKLDRVMFAGLTKKDLPRGRYRFLTLQEINFLKMS
jgi:23S rRNA pseudouridine2605 synthase